MKTSTQIRIESLEEALRSASVTIKAQKAQIQALKTTSDWDPYWCYVCDRPNNDCACEVQVKAEVIEDSSEVTK